MSQEPESDRNQKFWQQWVEDAFPDLDSRAYFLPPVYVNKVPMIRESIADEDVNVLHQAPGQAGQSSSRTPPVAVAAQTQRPKPIIVQDSDVRNDAAMQRLFSSFQTMKREVFVLLTNLNFEDYLGESAAANFPRSQKEPEGDFDFLIIHRLYGLIAIEVKAFGDNIKKLNMSEHNIVKNIRRKLSEAVSQLEKAETMLSRVVSDISPSLRITKTIAFPNLTSEWIERAIAGQQELIEVRTCTFV